MAIDDFWESPILLYRSERKSLAVNDTENSVWQDLHASKDTNEQQDDEHSSVEDKAKVY